MQHGLNSRGNFYFKLEGKRDSRCFLQLMNWCAFGKNCSLQTKFDEWFDEIIEELLTILQMFYEINSRGNFIFRLPFKKDINCFLQLMGYKHFNREIQLTNFDIWYKTIITNLLKEVSKFCHLCGKGFKCNTILSRHMTVHTNKRKYVCGCGKKYKYYSSLWNHTKIAHAFFHK